MAIWLKILISIVATVLIANLATWLYIKIYVKLNKDKLREGEFSETDEQELAVRIVILWCAIILILGTLIYCMCTTLF